jgi:hypothetical protein
MKEFTLVSVVNFLEKNGFHVRGAQEVENTVGPIFLGGETIEGSRGVIRVEITPKVEANP